MPPLYFLLFIFAPSVTVMAFIYFRAYKTLRYFSTVESQTVSGGGDAVRRVLDDFHLFDLQVRKAEGKRKSEYRMPERTVFLSAAVHDGRSFTALAKALHLAGYAVQHMRGEARLWVKHMLQPAACAGAAFSLAAVPLSLAPEIRFLYPAGALLFTVYMLFVFFLMPLELNSSRIVFGKMAETGLFNSQELQLIQKALAAVSLEKVTRLCTGI
ncbi:MAG: zinc metallopeptidase [Candidatus Omnitrophica bacterium]|nr:zinc metallopeptidase [Candidatus Omnitrophota bacterium]